MQGFPNYRQHRLSFLQYLIIPEAYNPQPLLAKPRIASVVTLGLSMLAAVQFDHEARLMTIKIECVG